MNVGNMSNLTNNHSILQVVVLHIYIIISIVRQYCLSKLRLSDNNSLDFVINHIFMKLFKMNNLETVTYCRMQFNFDLPSTILKKEVMFLLENVGCAVPFFCTLVVNLA